MVKEAAHEAAPKAAPAKVAAPSGNIVGAPLKGGLGKAPAAKAVSRAPAKATKAPSPAAKLVFGKVSSQPFPGAPKLQKAFEKLPAYEAPAKSGGGHSFFSIHTLESGAKAVEKVALERFNTGSPQDWSGEGRKSPSLGKNTEEAGFIPTPVAEKVIPEAVNVPVQTVTSIPSVAKAGVDLATGNPKPAAAMLKGFEKESALAHLLKGDLKGAAEAFNRHPLATGLEAYGGASALDHIAGAAARSGALGENLASKASLTDEGASTLSRKPQKLIGNATEPLTPYDKGLVRRLAQGKRNPDERLTDSGNSSSINPLSKIKSPLSEALKKHYDRTEGSLLRIQRANKTKVMNDRFKDISFGKGPTKKVIPGVDAINLYSKGVLSDPSVLNDHGTPLYRDQLSQLVEHHAQPVEGENIAEKALRESNMEYAQRLLEDKSFYKNPDKAYKAALSVSKDKATLEPDLVKHGVYTPEQMRTAKIVPAFQFHFRDQEPFVDSPPPYNAKGIAFNAAVKAEKDAKDARAGSLVALKEAKAGQVAAPTAGEQMLLPGAERTVSELRDAHKANVDTHRAAQAHLNDLMPKSPHDLHESPFSISDGKGGRKPITVDEIYQELHKKGVNDKQLSFVSTRPGINEKGAYYRPPHQESAGAKVNKGTLTGLAFKNGQYDPSYDAVVRQNLTDRGIVDQAQAVGYKNQNYALTKEHLAKLIEEKAKALPTDQQLQAKRLILELRTGSKYFEPTTEEHVNPITKETTKTQVSPWSRAERTIREIQALHPDLKLEPGRLAHQYATKPYLDALSKNTIQDIHDRLDPNLWHEPHTQFPTEEADQHSLENGEVGVFHKAIADKMRSYEKEMGKTNIAGQFGTFWRRANVAYSVRHIPGLLQEIGIRALVNKIGPMSYARGIKAYNDAMKAAQDPEFAKAHPDAAFNADRLKAMSGGTVAQATEDLARRVNTDKLWNTRKGKAVEMLKDATQRRVTGAPLRVAKDLGHRYQVVTKNLLDYQRKILEEPQQIAGLGKHLNDESKRLTGKSLSVIKAMQPVQQDLVHGLLDEKNLDAAARSLTEYWGDWTSASPELKKAMTVMPFANWYKNSLKFIYHTMPVHHPLATGIMVALEDATAAERQAQGQGYGGSFIPTLGPAALAERQQGSVPIGDGFVADQQYYTPSGAVAGGLEGALGSLFPYASDSWAILHGTNPLNGKTLVNEHNEQITGANEKILQAGLASLESFLPPVHIVKALTEKGKPEKEDPIGKALGVPPQIWKVFKPFRTEQEYTQAGTRKFSSPQAERGAEREKLKEERENRLENRAKERYQAQKERETYRSERGKR